MPETVKEPAAYRPEHAPEQTAISGSYGPQYVSLDVSSNEPNNRSPT